MGGISRLVSACGQWSWSKHSSDSKPSHHLAILQQRKKKHEQICVILLVTPNWPRSFRRRQPLRELSSFETWRMTAPKTGSCCSETGAGVLVSVTCFQQGWRSLLASVMSQGLCVLDVTQVTSVYKGQVRSTLNFSCLVVLSASFMGLMPSCKSTT